MEQTFSLQIVWIRQPRATVASLPLALGYYGAALQAVRHLRSAGKLAQETRTLADWRTLQGTIAGGFAEAVHAVRRLGMPIHPEYVIIG